MLDYKPVLEIVARVLPGTPKDKLKELAHELAKEMDRQTQPVPLTPMPAPCSACGEKVERGRFYYRGTGQIEWASPAPHKAGCGKPCFSGVVDAKRVKKLDKYHVNMESCLSCGKASGSNI